MDKTLICDYCVPTAVVGSVSDQSSSDEEFERQPKKRRVVTAVPSRRVLTRSAVSVDRGCGSYI